MYKEVSRAEMLRREKIAQMTCIFLNDHSQINRASALRSLKTLIANQCMTCILNQYMNVRGYCSCKKSSSPCLIYESALTENRFSNE